MTRLAILAVVGLCAAWSDAGPGPIEGSHQDGWLEENVFVGHDGCLAVWSPQRLERGDRLLLLEVDGPVKTVSVYDRISGRGLYPESQFEGVSHDSALWDNIGCYWGNPETPAAVARWARLREEEGLHLGIRGLPAGALVAGGTGRRLNPSTLSRNVARLAPSLLSKFTRSDVLRAGFQFPSSGGPEITRLVLGRALDRTERGGTAFDSLQICEVFLSRDRILSVEEFSRKSGEVEGAGTEPVRLDLQNWHHVPSRTIGFFSVDDGATWRRVTANVGPEGIWWAIWDLAKAPRLVWNRFVYTSP